MPTAQQRCCPEPEVDGFGPGPLTYVDSTGSFFNRYLGTWMTLINYTYSDPSTGHIYMLTDAYGKCVRTQPSPVAYGPLYDSMDCPCCPDGYLYVLSLSATGVAYNVCASTTTPVVFTEPIPCIECVCVEPPPPPDCESCKQGGGQPIHFAYNPFVKNCIDCVPQEFNLPTDCKMNAFLPYFIILPNTNKFTTE